MRNRVYTLLIALLLGGLILVGCGPVTIEPDPSPTAASGGDEVGPPDPAKARDAALAYLTQALGERMPVLDLAWIEKDVTAEGLVGGSSRQYSAGGWEVTVSFPIVAPEATIYQVLVANEETGFHWEGEVDAWLGVNAAFPGALTALDAAAVYLGEHYGQQIPVGGMGWTEERATAEGLVGGESYEYRSGKWLVAISYPVVAPDQMIYTIVAMDESTGFKWEGKVNAAGEVVEDSGPAASIPEGGDVVAPGDGEVELPQLVEGNSAFAFDLYQVLREGEGNLFYSPYSISLALAMTYAGARGETEAQMAEALSFLLSQEQLHPSFSALSDELAGRGEGAEGKDGEGFRLNIANAIWGQEGYEFLPKFLEKLADNYGAGMRLVDFIGATETARVTINDWVSEATEERIKDLIPPGVLDGLTRLVLTNAVYFNAAWAEPFDESQTQDGAFHLLDGGDVTVPMMAQTTSYAWASGEGYQAVELPYDGGELSMVILLPDEGAFETFESGLDSEAVEAILAELGQREVALMLPKFKFESEFGLGGTLAALGMPIAFSDDADFSGMTGDQELFISEVIHKSFVSVDEAGTEAAAATAVIMKLKGMAEPPLEVKVDRPFLFLIRDIETGTVLFVGRVMDPSA